MSSITAVSTSDAAPAAGPYSQAVKVGGMVYTSGQIPADKNGKVIEGNIEETTDAVFNNLEAVLKAAGSGLNRVIKLTVFLDDMANFGRMNTVYEKRLCGHKPARSCIAAKQLPKGVSIEIDCIALTD